MVLHRRISAVLKVCTNADTTLEDIYTVKLAWKLERAKRHIFIQAASEPPYCTISHVSNQSWHCYKFKCKCSSSIHNSSYWWVNDILTRQRYSPVEVIHCRSTECSHAPSYFPVIPSKVAISNLKMISCICNYYPKNSYHVYYIKKSNLLWARGSVAHM